MSASIPQDRIPARQSVDRIHELLSPRPNRPSACGEDGLTYGAAASGGATSPDRKSLATRRGEHREIQPQQRAEATTSKKRTGRAGGWKVGRACGQLRSASATVTACWSGGTERARWKATATVMAEATASPAVICRARGRVRPGLRAGHRRRQLALSRQAEQPLLPVRGGWSSPLFLDAGGPQHERPPVACRAIARPRQFNEPPRLALRQVGPPDRETAGYRVGCVDPNRRLGLGTFASRRRFRRARARRLHRLSAAGSP